MRITFKQRPRLTGLRSIGAAPRGYDVKVDGQEVGSINPDGGNWSRPLQGWYWTYRVGAEMVNTYPRLAATVDEAKAQVRDYIKALRE